MRKFSGHSEPWGEFVDIKINALELLRKELRRKPPGRIMLSSVTDPYQPIEAKLELTRRCLEILGDSAMVITILTKSNLITRDLVILKKLEQVTVGITITTDREEIRHIFEPFSSTLKERLEALRILHENHIQNYAFVGPLLPADPNNLAQLLAPIVDEVLVDQMNYSWKVKSLYEREGLSYAMSESYSMETQNSLIQRLTELGIPATAV